MKRFLKPKLILPLVASVLLAGTIFGTLAGNIFPARAQAPCCSITVSPTSGSPGTVVTVTGAGWTSGDTVNISISPAELTTLASATVAGDGTFTVSFTIPANEPQGNQFVDAINTAGDQTAQAPFTVTPPTPTPTPSPSPSPSPSPTSTPLPKPIKTKTTTPNWGGYISEGKTYSDIGGSWQVPEATCSKGENSMSGFFVGLDGSKPLVPFTPFGWLEQIGTSTGCIDGKPDYFAFWEMIEPGVITVPNEIDHPVKPYDSMEAEVKFVGLDAFNKPQFLLTIHDKTQKWGFSTTQGDLFVGAPRSSAECIVELPLGLSFRKLPPFFNTLPTNFGRVHFSDCQADDKPINSGPITDQQTIVNKSGTPLIKTLPPSPSGTDFIVDFIVKWKRSK